MPNSFTNTTFNTTYRDDFRDSDHYHRILFNSGRALQARELTQMQTIIHSEMERFGRHIFREGSVVNPGGLTVNTNYEFVKLETSDTTGFAVGNTIQGQSSSIKAEIIQIVAATGSDPATFYIKYIDASGSTSTGTVTTTPRFTPGETLTIFGGSTSIRAQVISTSENPAVGSGTRASVAGGSYFVRGHFVSVSPQSIIVSKYSATPTETIVMKYVEDIVTTADTNDLYDNQNNGIPNLTAPGADRYRITLTLSTESIVSSTDNFFAINRLVNGIIQQEIDETEYNRIGNELATRTKEESGDYVVEGYGSVMQAGDSGSVLKLNIQPGIAYVNGYRISKPSTTELTINKPRSTQVVEESIAANYGNYIIVSADAGQGFIPNIDTFETVNLRSAANYGGSTIGTTRVRSITEDGANYRLYIFDTKLNAGQKFSAVRSIGLGANEYFDLVLENSIAVVKEAINNNLLFGLGRAKPSLVDDITLTVQRRFTGTTNESGELPLTGLGTDESFSNQTQWIVAIDSASHQILPNATASGSTVTTGRGQEDDIEVITYVTKTASAATVRAKTRQIVTETGLTMDSDGSGFKFVKLANPDIFTLTSVVDSGSNVSLQNRFTLDNGQRDNFYYNGRLILKDTASVPTGNIKVTYDHFQHGTGDFFAANSYNATDIGYANIPVHRKANGDYADLRNVLDFRPYKESDGASYSVANINELPQNTDTISADITYYKGRNDILVLASNEGSNPRIEYIEGVQSLDNRITPVTPEGALKIKEFQLEPFTDDKDDLTETFIDNRRYTMRDISSIVDRIENLEETVSLNLLEAQTSAIEVLDSNGALRFKNGFFADDFRGFAFSDVASDQYTATIDPDERVILPNVVENAIPLVYDSASSTSVNTNLTNNNFLMLDYTEQVYTNQDLASETENVNPFEVITFVGNLRLSPAVDEWRETRRVNRIVQRVRNVTTRRSRTAFARNVSTQGRSTRVILPNGQRVTAQAGRVGSSTSSTFNLGTTSTTTQTIDRTITTSFGEITLLPFIRSRLIGFKAQALKPNTRHFLFFDGVLLTDPTGQNYTREETFQVFSRRTEDQFINSRSTTHPNTSGPSDLISNANGEIEGSFLIPNNDTLQFTTGSREVKLLDISVNNEQDAGSSAHAIYFARGETQTITQTTQENITNTRTLTTSLAQIVVRREDEDDRPRRRPAQPVRGRRDPLAQSFTIQNSEGAFITKIDAYFSTKDTTVPVRMEIRPLRNGVPSQTEVIPGSEVVVNPSAVNIPGDLNDLTSVRATPTPFVFDSPVYLRGGVPYAFVLMADTVAYNVYVAEAGGFVLGKTDQRIQRQPTLGSLFLSQNAETWTPDQTRDMMFRIHRADFVSSGTALLENLNVPRAILDIDPISTDSGSATVTINHLGHGFGIGDKFQLFGVDSNTSYGGITGTSLQGTRTITGIDGNSFTFTADSAATSTQITGDSSISMTQCIQMDQVLPAIDVLIPDAAASVTMQGTFASGRSIVPASGDGTNAQNNFAISSAFEINPGDPILFESPQVVANRETEDSATTLLGSPSTPRRSVNITASMTTVSSFISPVILMNNAQLIGVNNLIDNQDSSSGSFPNNVPLTYIAETNATSGTSLSKHLTIPIAIEQPAVGLKVIAGVNRPFGSNIDLYFRTLAPGSDTSIDEIPFTLAPQDTIVQTDEDLTIFRDYEYTIGGLNGTLEPFTIFQLKIVMRSQNSSKVPAIRDLRAIALGT